MTYRDPPEHCDECERRNTRAERSKRRARERAWPPLAAMVLFGGLFAGIAASIRAGWNSDQTKACQANLAKLSDVNATCHDVRLSNATECPRSDQKMLVAGTDVACLCTHREAP